MGRTITSVGVVGLGSMGAGIAQVCLRAGLPVVGREASPELVERSRSSIERQLDRDVEKGRLDAEGRARAAADLTTTTDLGAMEGCDIVIEAIVENIDAKHALFRELQGVVRADTLLASNTSALSVTQIASVVDDPSRVLGLHFFNPAPVLQLVEVVRAELTSDEAYEAGYAFAQQIGKEPIRCNDTPGFVVNRILIPILNDAVRVLDETGASPEDIDNAMRLGTAWPIGPLALIDLVGVDVQVFAAQALWSAHREPRMYPPDRLVRMVNAGLLGRKTGRGFYTYDAKGS